MNNVRILKTISRFFVNLSFLIILLACAQAGNFNEKDIEAITKMSEARATAFNNKNAGEIANYFTEDGILMAPGQAATSGRKSVEEYYQKIFDQYEPKLTSHYEEVEVAGDLAYGRGIATVELKSRNGGETETSTAKYLNILKRQADGSWKTTHDIWNNN
ncbi:hypothetical protein BH23BAC1_BH23BAC1_14370 [soil metagenome]